jgi:hypothetical protein
MDPDAAVLVAEGHASEIDVLLLGEQLGPGATKGAHADLTLPFRAASYVSIGDPVVTALPADQLATAALRDQVAGYEFHQVQLACSFQAAAGCRFTQARFATELLTAEDSPGSRAPGTTDAIAYDLFPQLVEEPRTVTVTSSIKPEITLGYDPVSATLALPSRERVVETVQYRSRITAFDLQGGRPAWQFTATDQREISGPQQLFILIRKPKGTSVQARFQLNAQVQFVIGGTGLAPVELVMVFRRRGREAVLQDAPDLPLC